MYRMTLAMEGANDMTYTQMKRYFIRVTNVGVFNSLVQAAEAAVTRHKTTFDTHRQGGYYKLVTPSATLWNELYLYGQVLAQAQDEHIEGGEERTA